MPLVDPYRGSKLIVAGRYQKSGKTLFIVCLVLSYLKKYPDCFAYGNMFIKHSRYKKVTKLTLKHFRKKGILRYIVVIDEADLNYPWQMAHKNQGFWAFWGKGASHNRCAVVISIQNEYKQMAGQLQRTNEVYCDGVIFEDNLPILVIGDLINPLEPFKQDITNAVGKYDPYENDDLRINFSDFIPRHIVEEKKRSTAGITNKNTLRATKKLAKALVNEHGSIASASRSTGVSRNWLQQLLEETQ